jgi:spore coat protein U-like protein
VAFGAVANASTTFGVTCTSTLPYTMALDATSGTVLGLNYTLALSAASGTGNGVLQTYAINGSIAAGQPGTCATGSCAASQPRTLTITY